MAINKTQSYFDGNNKSNISKHFDIKNQIYIQHIHTIYKKIYCIYKCNINIINTFIYCQ